MRTYSHGRDGGYPAGVTSGDPHFDLPNADQRTVWHVRRMLHCDHTWQLRVHKFTNDFMSYKQCIKCGKLADIEIHYRKEREEP